MTNPLATRSHTLSSGNLACEQAKKASQQAENRSLNKGLPRYAWIAWWCWSTGCLPNTWQIDGELMRFGSALRAFCNLPIFIG